MKREEVEKLLKDAGIEDSKTILEGIMSLHGKTMTTTMSELEKAKATVAELEKLKSADTGKQAEIDKAVEEAKKAIKEELEAQFAKDKTELETKYETEKAAAARVRALKNTLSKYNDEQKSLLEDKLKEADLTLSEDGEGFSNFDELAKPIQEKFPTLFPVDGSKGKGGLGGGEGKDLPKDEFADLRNLR